MKRFNQLQRIRTAVRIETDGKYAVIPPHTIDDRLPIEYLHVFKHAVQQAVEHGAYETNENAVHIRALSHVDSYPKRCSNCGKRQSAFTEVYVLGELQSTWDDVHTLNTYCESCTQMVLETVQHELNAHPDKYLGHAL